MREKLIAVTLTLVLAMLFAATASGQIDSELKVAVAVPDFVYEGTLWADQLGGAAADSLISRMRIDRNYIMLNREPVNEVLERYGITAAYGADLTRLGEAFKIMQAEYAIVGRITSIQQTEEAPNKFVVHVVLDAQIIDPRTPFIITSERVETDVKLKKPLSEEAEWNAKEAKNLFKSATNRLRQRFRSVFLSRSPM